MNRGDLTNEQWWQLEPFLPSQKPRTGRPSLDHRTVMNGILWVLRTGAPWRDMPERYGKWTTIYSRFQRWRKNGTWDRIFAQLQTIKDREGLIDWQIHFIDGSIVRAHKHAAGEKSTLEKEALGRSRGGLTTKIHVRVDGKGQSITFLLTPGQTSEISMAERLMEQGAVRRYLGRPKIRPSRVVGDKGYTSAAFRSCLRRRGIRITIARRSNQRRRGSFDKAIYRQRNKVERIIGRIKEFRRIATRYEKRATNYLAVLTIAAIFLWSQGFAYTP